MIIKNTKMPSDLQHTTQVETISLTEKENAKYRCSQCNYICSDSNAFVQHMIDHNPNKLVIKNAHNNEVYLMNEKRPMEFRMKNYSDTRYGSLPADAAEEKPDSSKSPKEGLSVQKEANQASSVDEPPVYIGKVVQSKPNALFVHDINAARSARFRCTICGYICEHQRTIKAHIWKHSGNKDIDYPSFQNGPLSIYDDWTPVNVVEEEKLKSEKKLGSSIGTDVVPEGNDTTDEKTASISQRLCATVEAIKVKSPITSISPVAPALANFLAMKAKLKDEVTYVEGDERSYAKNSTIIGNEMIIAETVHNVSCTASTENVSSKSDEDKKEGDILAESSNPLVVKMDTDEIDVKDTVEVILDHEFSKLPDAHGVESVESIGKRKLHTSSTEEEGEMQQVAKRFCNDNSTDDGADKHVVVERVDSFNSDTYTGLRSEMNSPRVTDPGNDNDSGVASVSLGSPGSSVSTAVRNRQCIDVPTDDAVTKEENDGNETDDNALVIDVATSRPQRVRTTSASMTESAVTLLSLLQKGPNINPACPIPTSESVVAGYENVTTSESMSKPSDSKSKEFGISSSLLAVIEQLRERSKEGEVLDTDDSAGSKRGTKKKIKKEPHDSLASIEGLDNVEKFYDEDEEKYRCKLCHYTNNSTFVLLQHMRLHKEKKPSECSLCEFVASSSEDLQDHMIKHCKVRTYQCKLCPSAFNYKSQLRAHMRAHNDKEVFVCDECDFESNNPSTFRNHVRGHSEKKFYKCEVCDKCFVSKPELKTHKKGECSKKKSFSCDECDFVAIGPQEQKLHAKVHAKEFDCKQCDYVTTSISRFQNHAKTHEEKSSLKCELCDFPAVSTRSLKSHMKRHINDQRFVQQPLEQYKCNLCGYVCHHLPSLKSHMWRHASDATYSYQFTNEVINAAIDYDCRLDTQSCEESDIAVFSQTIKMKLKERLERQGEIGEADLNSKAVCWVTFRCCQCGFETINKAQLSMHMKSHSDVIKWTLQVAPQM